MIVFNDPNNVNALIVFILVYCVYPDVMSILASRVHIKKKILVNMSPLMNV